MRTSTRLAAAAILAVPATALSATAATAASASPAGGAVFVQNDNVDGNAVVAYDRSGTGALRQAGVYPTGGRGGMLTGSQTDHLGSQGSLVFDRAHDTLYAVNAGSDTLSSFSVRGDKLTNLRVYRTSGSFPVSIAVRGDLVYVLNARDGGSVQGYLRTPLGLLPLPGSHRALGLGAPAAPEFVHTPGQIAFAPDGRHLIVTTKAATSAVELIPLDPHGAIVSTVEAGAVPFAVDVDRYGHLITVQAGPSALASGRVAGDGTVSTTDTALTGQTASCWITGDGRTFFVASTGSATVSAYRVGADGTLTALGNTPTDAGPVDEAESPDHGYLYVQTGGTGAVDSFRIGPDGALTRIGTVAVPNAVGGQGIVAV